MLPLVQCYTCCPVSSCNGSGANAVAVIQVTFLIFRKLNWSLKIVQNKFVYDVMWMYFNVILRHQFKNKTFCYLHALFIEEVCGPAESCGQNNVPQMKTKFAFWNWQWTTMLQFIYTHSGLMCLYLRRKHFVPVSYSCVWAPPWSIFSSFPDASHRTAAHWLTEREALVKTSIKSELAGAAFHP